MVGNHALFMIMSFGSFCCGTTHFLFKNDYYIGFGRCVHNDRQEVENDETDLSAKDKTEKEGSRLQTENED